MFIIDQQPEGLRTRRKYEKEMCDELQAVNAGKADKDKVKAVVKKDRLFVNSNLYKKPCHAPQPQEIHEIDDDGMDKMDKMTMVKTKPCANWEAHS